MGDLGGGPFLDNDLASGRRLEVASGFGCDDDERDVVSVRGQRQRVGADLVATEPAAAMRSAPTMTQSTCPVAIAHAAAESIVRRCGIPASASSQAVNRAPCSSGRVSSTSTSATLPRACNTRSAPSAVPNAVVASRPVLQWVSTRSGRSGDSRSTSSAARGWRTVGSPGRPRSTVPGPRRARRPDRWAAPPVPFAHPQVRFTAVGRADAIRSACSVAFSASPACA